MESEPKLTNVMIGSGDITPKGKAQFYSLAAACAINLSSNSMALAFAEKAIVENPTANSYLALASASAGLGTESLKNNDYAAALKSFQKATDAYETSKSATDFQITNVDLNVVAGVYDLAAQTARRLGSNDLASHYDTNYLETVLKIQEQHAR
jgi:tetratricopeptide (TPR) repeat protein